MTTVLPAPQSGPYVKEDDPNYQAHMAKTMREMQDNAAQAGLSFPEAELRRIADAAWTEARARGIGENVARTEATQQLDPLATNYLYRGDPALAEQDIARYRGMADAINAQAHPEGIGVGGWAYEQANQALANNAGARALQLDAVQNYKGLADGTGPSIYKAAFQQALDASNRNAMSIAASARGGGLQRGAANRMAMQYAGDSMQANSAAAAQMSAQERLAGMQGYAGAIQQMRQGDIAQGQLGTSVALADADTRLKSQAQMEAILAQRRQSAMGYEQLGQGVAAAQTAGNTAYNESMMQRYLAQIGAADRAQDRAAAAEADRKAGNRADRNMFFQAAGAAIPIAGSYLAHGAGKAAGSGSKP